MKRRLFILAVFICVSLLTRALFLRVEILDIDESAHIVGSWQLLQGKLLYTDFVNNKPPLLYVYYAAAQLLFGRGMFAVHLLTALFTIPLTAFAASAFYSHNRTGVVAGILFLIYSASFLAHDMHASHTEILMILPASWALVLVRDEYRARNFFRIGLASFLVGVAMLFKQPAGIWLLAILASAAIACKHRKIAFRFVPLMFVSLIGFAIPLLLTYLYFDLKDGAQALLYWLLKNNLTYSANPISLKEGVGRAASYLLPFLVVTAPLWWGSYRSLMLQKSIYRKSLICLLLVLSLAVTFVGFRFFPHYFIILYVPLSIGAAIYVDRLLRLPLSVPGKLFIGYSVLILVGFTIANAFLYFGSRSIYRERDPVFHQVTQRLQRDECFRGGTLFVWGYAPIFYYDSGLQPASRFVVLAPSGLTSYVSGNLGSVTRGPGSVAMKSEIWNLLMSDLEQNRATYIIDTAPSGLYRWNHYPLQDYPVLDRYVRENYERLDEISGMVLYRRLHCNPNR